VVIEVLRQILTKRNWVIPTSWLKRDEK
jgi:hypothetical protein